jgi:hypothetical protein
VKLVDFNPFSPTTDGLLFEWPELYQSMYHLQSHSLWFTFADRFAIPPVSPDDNNAEMRIITSQVEANMRARCAPSFSSNMVPKDVVDLSNGQTIAQFAENFHKAMEMQRDSEYSSDDEDEPQIVQK